MNLAGLSRLGWAIAPVANIVLTGLFPRDGKAG